MGIIKKVNMRNAPLLKAIYSPASLQAFPFFLSGPPRAGIPLRALCSVFSSHDPHSAKEVGRLLRKID
jgi:hypothetical protein